MRYTRHSSLCILASTLVCLRATPTSAQSADSLRRSGVSALVDFGTMCNTAAAALWPVSLCGPAVLVDPDTRLAITNRRPTSGAFVPDATARGIFVGTLPDSVIIANTAVDWDNARWTMIMLPIDGDAFDRRRLFAHEAFHRIQPTLGVSALNAVAGPLDERDARYWLRLELAALVASARDTNRAQARTDACAGIAFAAERRRAYPTLDSLESVLEISEGLAEYTGVAVAARVEGRAVGDATEWSRNNFERLPSFVRSYGYGAGPLLGAALDRFAPRWRDSVRTIHSLTAAVARAARCPGHASVPDLARYDGARIAAKEDRRAEARSRRVAQLRSRLVDGPVVIFEQRSLSGGFNPNTIVPLGADGLVYPARDVSAEWGALHVASGGLLVSTDRSRATVTASGLVVDRSAGRASGDGWTLELAAGWTLQSGSRAGDWIVTPAAKRPP